MHKKGGLVYYAPLFEITESEKSVAFVVADQNCPIEPYRLLIGGNVVKAMHQEVWELDEHGI
jgi:hypothetical protein